MVAKKTERDDDETREHSLLVVGQDERDDKEQKDQGQGEEKKLREEKKPQTITTHRIYLAPHRGDPLTGPLGWLAKFYDLDVHGTTKLGSRAGKEMGYVALLLTVIFLFDFAAWSILWNTIFHSGQMRFNLFTFIALAIALIFAAATLIYERQFMTADTSGGWRKLWQPVLIRFTVIFVAAIVTTQPVEVVVFNGPIQRRIHEESIRREAAHRMSELEESKRMATQLSALEGSIELEDKKKAEQKADLAQSEVNRLEAEQIRLRGSLSGTESALAAARRSRNAARNPRQYEAANRRVASLEGRVSNLRAQLNQVEADLGGKKADEKDAREQADNATEKVASKQKGAQDTVRRLRDWITQLDNSDPGVVVTEASERPDRWTFRDQSYDFFERLTVLDDIYHGRPARWKNAGIEDRQRLATEYGLKDIAQDDDEARVRRDNDARLFKFSYWAVVGIALVIPLLVLALKRILPQELKDYYSTNVQRESGNYDARKYAG